LQFFQAVRKLLDRDEAETHAAFLLDRDTTRQKRLDINNNSTDNADVSNMQESEMGIMSSSSTVRVHLETAMRAES
jgi:hypothetical protein